MNAGVVFLDDSGSVKPVPPLSLLAQMAHHRLLSPGGWTRERGLITAKSTQHHCLWPPMKRPGYLGYLLTGTAFLQRCLIHSTFCWPGKTQMPFQQACIENFLWWGRWTPLLPLPLKSPTGASNSAAYIDQIGKIIE